MAELPRGTVTFLFTDIEGSTRLWEQHSEAMEAALARHDFLLRKAIEAHDGCIFKTVGDAFCAAFPAASGALGAALAAQQSLRAEPWGQTGSLRVRMALNTGVVEPRSDDYFGPALNRVARLLAAGHGGQLLLSQATSDLLREALPPAMSLRDLGVHRLKDLQQPEHVFQLLHPALPADFPPLRSLEAFAHNLPVQLTRFIGREEAMTEVKRLLTTTHLLTLTGAGGCGKTRLALQVAAELLEAYPDGIWLVELAALADPALVPQTVAAALGVREEPGRPLLTTLSDYLRPKSLLLVLDNCEHLLSASAQLAESLLRACPQLRILASSREGLNIAGESSYRVPSLSLPDPQRLPPVGAGLVPALSQFEAARLFVERAAAAAPSFRLSESNAGAVAQVCLRLDGIPLALELAAARVKALPVEKINERLDDRFRLLTGGSRTALPRQQTLRALIDWSYDLLTEPERLLLRRLSVFAGGWTLEAAEAVCAGEGLEEGEILDLLRTLVEKSLVLYEERIVARYRLLETMRQYARDRLIESGEAEQVRDRHLDFFLELAERAEPELLRHEQVEWLDRLEREHDNLRLALEWARAPGRTGWTELRLAGALAGFWAKRSYLSEGRDCVDAALSRSGEAPASARLRALLGAGHLENLAADYATSVPFLEAALTLARATGDPSGIALALSRLMLRAALAGDREQATALAEESLVRAQEAGDPWLIGFCLQVLGLVARMNGDPDRAATYFRDSLALVRQVGDKWDTVFVLLNVGGLAQARDEFVPARRAYQEALGLSQELKDRRGMAWCLECLAEVAAAQGQAARGARLSGAAGGLLEAIGASWPPPYVAGRERALAAIRAAMGEEPAAAALAEGRAMTWEQAVGCAREGTDA